MPIKVAVDGELKPIVRIQVMADGALKVVRRVMVYENDQWREVFTAYPVGGFTATPSPNPVSGSRSINSVISVRTAPVTVTASGGAAPYSYAWSQTGGQTCSISDPSSPTTTFAMPLGPESDEMAFFRCTVTDSLGSKVHVPVTGHFVNHGKPWGNGGWPEP